MPVKIKQVVFLLYYESIRANLYLNLSMMYLAEDFNVTFVVQDLRNYFKVRSFFSKSGRSVTIKLFRISDYSPKVNELRCIERSIDFISGNYNEVESELLYTNYKYFLEKNLKSGSIVYAGNGLHLQDFALKDSTINIYSVFNDLANIDQRVFLDPEGANCNSSFYKKELNLPPLSSEQEIRLERWKSNYKQSKLKAHTVPQVALNFYKPTLLERAKNALYTGFEYFFNIGSINVIKHRNVFNFLTYKLFNTKKHIKKTNLDDVVLKPIPSNKDYIFVPLQVTNDTQILLNSKYDNMGAINYFRKQAQESGRVLVLKLHPAEPSDEFKQSIYQLQNSDDDIYLSKGNTFELINNASKVGVNNSTAGFEAMLLGIETEFIGKTYYSKLHSNESLYYYLFTYLLKINFFTGEVYDDQVLTAIHKNIGYSSDD